MKDRKLTTRSLRMLVALLMCAMAVPLVMWRTSSAAPQNAPQSDNKGVNKFRRSGKPARDQYIVVLKNETKSEEVEAVTDDLLMRHAGVKRHVYKHSLKGFSIQMTEAAAIALSQEPSVEYVQEDIEVKENTTQWIQPISSWGLDRVDQRTNARDTSYYYPNTETGAGVNAYVIDSGIRMNHTEFRTPSGSTRVSHDADFVDGQFNDCNGHGTFVAGIIGGKTFGVAKDVRLHNIRVFGCDNWTWASTIIAGIDWVTANHVKPAVANLSLGVDPDFPIIGGIYYPIEDAIRNSIAAGVVYTAAAGNDHRDARDTTPARMPEVITVGATDMTDTKAWFSNFGPAVDLFAPGDFITSASITDFNNNGIFDDSAVKNGTSFAAPFVAGAAARFLQTNPLATPAAVQGAIVNAATPNVVNDRGQDSPNLLLYTDFHGSRLSQTWIPTISEGTWGVDTWVDVGLNEWLAMTGAGSIWAGVFFTGNNGPQGWNSIENGPAFPLPGSRPFSLIGTLDAQNFYIGLSNATGPNAFNAPKRLSLRTNDDVPGNGNGAFSCMIEKWKKLPDAGADFVSQSVPSTLLPGQTVNVSITMKNVGPSTWTAGQLFRLRPVSTTNWSVPYVTLPSDVLPGGQVTFNFPITAPLVPGTYNFQWRMIQDAVQWFGDVTPNVSITVLAFSNQAQFISQTVKTAMYASEFYTVSVTMKNTGNTTWPAGSAYRLGSQNPQDNMTWGTSRVTLWSNVPPGGTYTFTFDVMAPPKAGTYNFQWRMVQDGVEWFGDTTPNVAVSVKLPPCLRC